MNDAAMVANARTSALFFRDPDEFERLLEALGDPSLRDVLDEALASIARANFDQPLVPIKALEWDEFGRAHSVLGTYNVYCVAKAGWFGLFLPGEEDRTFPNAEGSEQECRAAAQAHFEAAIRSVLVSPLSPNQEG